MMKLIILQILQMIQVNTANEQIWIISKQYWSAIATHMIQIIYINEK